LNTVVVNVSFRFVRCWVIWLRSASIAVGGQLIEQQFASRQAMQGDDWETFEGAVKRMTRKIKISRRKKTEEGILEGERGEARQQLIVVRRKCQGLG
jgi:hypothetical protein